MGMSYRTCTHRRPFRTAGGASVANSSLPQPAWPLCTPSTRSRDPCCIHPMYASYATCDASGARSTSTVRTDIKKLSMPRTLVRLPVVLRHATYGCPGTRYIYLIRAGSSMKPQILSDTNADRNIYSSVTWYHTDPHEQPKRVTARICSRAYGLR